VIAGELSEEEAEMLLRQYLQAEAPRHLLNVYQQRQGSPDPVLKDW